MMCCTELSNNRATSQSLKLYSPAWAQPRLASGIMRQALHSALDYAQQPLPPLQPVTAVQQ
jgi:hypothetical protein